MPELAVGDLVAIPVSGAYQLSMASNYNGSLKPAVVWLHGGKSQLIQRRETVDDLLDRDLSLAKPGVTG
jgi:diaminopimelate decarboxylase